MRDGSADRVTLEVYVFGQLAWVSGVCSTAWNFPLCWARQPEVSLPITPSSWLRKKINMALMNHEQSLLSRGSWPSSPSWQWGEVKHILDTGLSGKCINMHSHPRLSAGIWGPDGVQSSTPHMPQFQPRSRDPPQWEITKCRRDGRQLSPLGPRAEVAIPWRHR